MCQASRRRVKQEHSRHRQSFKEEIHKSHMGSPTPWTLWKSDLSPLSNDEPFCTNSRTLVQLIFILPSHTHALNFSLLFGVIAFMVTTHSQDFASAAGPKHKDVSFEGLPHPNMGTQGRFLDAPADLQPFTLDELLNPQQHTKACPQSTLV